MQVTVEARRGVRSLELGVAGSSKLLNVGAGTELWFFGRTESAVNHRAISPVLVGFH